MKHGPNYGRQNNLLTDSMNERTNYTEASSLKVLEIL